MDCAIGKGRIYIGSRLFLGLAVALGSKFMGIGRKISFGGSSLASFPLPPLASPAGSSSEVHAKESGVIMQQGKINML